MPVVCDHCGASCMYAGLADEPCWGEVDVLEESDDFDWTWIHFCQGHAERVRGEGEYVSWRVES